MTVEAARRILWIALLVALPVPYWVMEGGWVPTIWLYELAGFTLAVLVTEGGTIVSLITGLFVLEAIAATAGLYVVARFAASVLEGALPAEWRTGSTVTLVVLLLASALLRLYTTPLIEAGERVNLLRLFA